MEKKRGLPRMLKLGETSLRLRAKRIGLLLLLSGIALTLITIQADAEVPRQEIHQISIRYTLTLSFRKERAYDYWWYSVLQGDRGLHGQIAAQLLGETRKLHPNALINNITIRGYEDAVESRINTDSSHFIRKIYLKGHSIQLSFQVSNVLVAANNGLVNVTTPLRGIRLEAKTKIAASAYYGYLMCPIYTDEEVEANLFEVFDFQAFDRPFQSGSWKRKSDELRRLVREECGIWGVIYKQMTISWKDESTKSTVMDRVAWSSVSFMDSTSAHRERNAFSRGDCLILGITGILTAVSSEDRRRRRSLTLIMALTAVLAAAHIPKLIEFFAPSERHEGRGETQRMETVDRRKTNSTFNEKYLIERTPIILDTITKVELAACTTPTVMREINVTHPFTAESSETEIIPVFSEPSSRCSGMEEGIDPEGMNTLCVARMTYTHTLGHRQTYASTVTPVFPTDYGLVSGRAWARANSLTTRSDTVLSDSCEIGWTTEPPWSIAPDSGNLRLRYRIAPALVSSEHWSYKDLAIPYYDPDTIGSISLVFDEFRRRAEPGTIEMVTGSSWSSYTEQPQCGSRGINIRLSSPQTGSFRFAWTCQRLEGHSGGIAYPLNYRVSSGDTLLASWSVTRTSESGNANYGAGANNWPMGCGTILIIVDENGNQRNLLLGQVNQDPRWGDQLGGTLGYGGSAQNVDVNKLFQSTYGRTLEGCTLLSFYLYGWVGHCAWSGVGEYAFLDVSFSNVSIKARRDASARETVQIRSAPEGLSLTSLLVHDSKDMADDDWELEKSKEIPREIWGEILGRTVRIALGVEYAGGDIDLLFDNLAVKITFSRAKLVYSGGNLLVADQNIHELPGFNGGEVRYLGADYEAELRCLVSKTLYTESHSMTIQTHGNVVHSIALNAGYPISPLKGTAYSDYNATITLPSTYSWIRVTDPAGFDITSQSTISQHNTTHIELTIRSGGFESSRYGTYRIRAESPNRVRTLNYNIAAWNTLKFCWGCRDSETVSNGEWTLYVYDPDGLEVFSQSGRIHECTITTSCGDWVLREGDKRGTCRTVLVWHNGTEGGAADAEIQVCSIRIQCEDLDGNPLHQAIAQISRDGNIVGETQTDRSGVACQTLLPGRYGLGVRVDGALVGEGSVDIQAGEASPIVQCSVCSPEIRVIDENERPIVGAETAVVSPNGSFRTILTDGYGKAQLRNIIIGNYEVSVLWRGLEVGNSTLSIHSSATIPIVCDVHTLTVSICDSAGGLLPYSTLVVDFPNGTERTLMADGFGKVEFEQVSGGTHRLRVYWTSQQVYDDTVQFTSSSPIVIYTTVEPREGKNEETALFSSGWEGSGVGTSDESSEDVHVFCSLTVEVVDGTGGPIQGAEVRVVDLETGQLLSTITTKVDGTATILVKTGRYELEAQKGKITARKVVELRSDRTIRMVLELEEEEREEPPLTIVSAGIAILGSALYLIYRKRSEG